MGLKDEYEKDGCLDDDYEYDDYHDSDYDDENFIRCEECDKMCEREALYRVAAGFNTQMLVCLDCAKKIEGSCHSYSED